MYLPSYFEESSTEVIHELISQYPLGILFTNGKNGPDASHLPFELRGQQGSLGVLHTHVARKNPVWQELSDGETVLVVFRAGDAYISPNWYPSKHELHHQVPTWNYRVVHAHGKVTVRDDERYVRGVVARLTRTHEASQPEPWKMRDLNEEAMASMLKAIVGLEIEITSLVGKFKLGQNKGERDLRGAAEALLAQGEQVISEAMLAVRNDVDEELLVDEES